ncbi:MAG: hypothetical protein JSS49_27065 [Planctomycetes bacterium]|nr:hypothetical protein [Planctomycetota bacterium]
MLELVNHLQELLTAGWNVLVTLLGLVLPWTPLIAWVTFWLLAVNWVKLRGVIIQGGWIAIVFLGLMMILVWGVVAPPADGSHHLFGLNVTNFVGKTVYVTALLTIMFLCGSVQLSGACGTLAQFPEDVPDEDHGHGHDAHGEDHGHGHAQESHGQTVPAGH